MGIPGTQRGNGKYYKKNLEIEHVEQLNKIIE